ncbi:MFS transporter [Trujillonella endophytica]|uniref:Nitrate/nitrite transporter NarK n=1 Tax=Trujillonella endophytica TaxID=673521 RepID=A0A1H8QHU9_9ACTN|nr:MFS transporter [Trujillella endophytica]SEO53606.1 Nitrate/nitrite transporter NarK [Trujillella endophytica]
MRGTRGAATRPDSSRLAVLVVCTAAMGLGCTPAFLVGYLGPDVRSSLDLSGAQLGLLVGLFYGATGVTSMVASRFVDPLGPRLSIVGDQALVAVALVAAALWPGFGTLAAASALAGAGYAFANAGTSIAVTSVSRPAEAGTAVAVKTAGIPLGATVLALAGLPLAGVIGWEGVALVLAGLLALNTVAGALLLPRARVRRVAGAPAPVVGRLPARFGWVVLASFFYVLGSQPLFSWLVITLVDAGVSRPAAGAVSATGTALGAVVMVLAARRADRAGPGRRALTAAGVAGTAVVGTALVWAGSHTLLAVLVVGAVVAILADLVGSGFAHGVAIDRAPHAVGRATAVMSSGYYLGALVSPLAFGAAADLTGSYDASWALTVGAMTACGLCFLVVQRWVRPPAAEPGAHPWAPAGGAAPAPAGSIRG